METLTIVTIVLCVINMSLSMGNIIALTSSWGKFDRIMASFFSKTQAEFYSVFAESCRNAVTHKKQTNSKEKLK